jgi:uncharacterized delta-60 repeat protein
MRPSWIVKEARENAVAANEERNTVFQVGVQETQLSVSCVPFRPPPGERRVTDLWSLFRGFRLKMKQTRRRRMKTRSLPCLVLSGMLVNLELTASAAALSLESQPQSQAVILYQEAAFGVMASGTPPLSYQWRKDGVSIAGATNDQIVLAHAQFSDEGGYSVVVADAENSLISTEAKLTVNPPKPGDLDHSFALGASINGPISSMAVQPDGRILIAGSFTTVHGAVRGGIARLSADGTTDDTFMTGLPGVAGSLGNFHPSVSSIALQSDGKVLIGGIFTTVNGESRNGIARLNANGTLDSSFQNGLSGIEGGFPSSVQSLALQSDGKVLIGGYFSTVNGESRNSIARLNTDGSLDSNFQNGLSGVNGEAGVEPVRSLAVQRDGKVLVGGIFTTINDVSRGGIARLNADGTLDASFQNGLAGTGGPDRHGVFSIAVQNDDVVLIGGIFTTVNEVRRGGIARLNADGTLDSGFQPTVDPYSIIVQSDGKVLVGGIFSKVNGVSRNNIARLNADGTLDEGFLNGLSGTDGAVNSIALQGDGKLLLGGVFATVNDVSRLNIARLNTDGALDGGFQNPMVRVSGPFLPSVDSVALQSDGRVLIGGEFTTVDGVSRNRIARLNGDGTLDPVFLNGQTGADDTVYSVAVQSDDKVLIGGAFAKVNGVGRSRIARLNAEGALDSGFQNTGLDGEVRSLVIQSDGKVLIGGSFANVSGVSRIGIARLHVDGSLDASFREQGLSGVIGIFAVAVQSDGMVLIGGYFDSASGANRNRIARLLADGSVDSDFLNGLSGADELVRSIAVQRDGKVLIGGDFSTVNDESRSHIARLHADGTLDSDFQNGLSGASAETKPYGSVFSMAVQSDGKVVIGGQFTAVNDVSRNHIARLNADGTLDSSFQNGLPGTNGDVASVALRGDGNLIIGGAFSTVNGVLALAIARLWGSTDLPPQIKGIHPFGADINLIWDALPNRTYRVQYKSNLSSDNWADLAGDTSAAAPTASKTDTTLGDASQRFYRVLLLP